MFENTFTLTKPLVREYSLRLWISRSTVKIYLGFLTLLFGIGIASFVLDANAGIARWFAVLFLPLYLIFTLILIDRSADKLCRRLKEKHEGELPQTVCKFQEDGLYWNDGTGVSRKLSYISFTKVLQTKHLYILIFQGSQGMYLRKDGFIRGDASSFDTFIKTKIKG